MSSPYKSSMEIPISRVIWDIEVKNCRLGAIRSRLLGESPEIRYIWKFAACALISETFPALLMVSFPEKTIIKTEFLVKN